MSARHGGEGAAPRGGRSAGIPFWLLRTLDRQLVGIRDRDQLAGTAGLGEALAPMGQVIARLLGSDAHRKAGVRLFEMRPQDLQAWDHYRRTGSGGFAYGTLVDGRGRFTANVQIRETTPASAEVGARGVDPGSLLAAVGQLKMQADLARIERKLDSNLLLSEEILWQLAAHDRAEVAAAADTTRRVFEDMLVDGAVSLTDWLRVAGLEQPLKRTRAKAADELARIAQRLEADRVSEASKVRTGDAQRVLQLFELLTRIQVAGKRFSAIRFSVLSTEYEVTESVVRRELEREGAEADQHADLYEQVQRAVADAPIQSRGEWEKLGVDGLLVGWLRDEWAIRRVSKEREAVRRGLEPPLPGLEPSQVKLALPAAISGIGAGQ